jgi:hypothetical protein
VPLPWERVCLKVAAAPRPGVTATTSGNT